MMASRDSAGAVAGGLARHIPVLGRSVVELLDVRAGEIYVDATFGAGGHSSAILAAANCNVIAIDRDPNAIARGADFARSARDRLALVEDNFSDLQAIVRNCGYEAIDGEGRAILTEPLKTHAGIKDEIAFAGLGHKFQIWEPERFRAELAEATEKVRALTKQLGSRVAAEGPHGARE